jgi:hypothetical protein
VTVLHARLRPVPIGISNTMWPHGNLRKLLRAMQHVQRDGSRTPSPFMKFSVSTHPSRLYAADALRAAFPDADLDPAPALPWPAYLAELGRHKFSACPRGNGIDTHRVWESLCLGVTPIVERSVLTEHWRALGLPMVLVDDWAEVSRERLAAEAASLLSRWPREPLRLSTYRPGAANAAGESGS